MQDTSIIKQKIFSILQTKGPSLPVHISGDIEQSILFTSAFLSELVHEKKIKMTYMRVGSSPIYYTPEQKEQIQKYAEHLKDKEKEAFHILKEKQIIKDSEEPPAIRVALRQIKDFAIPFKNNEELYWKFFTAPDQEIPKKIIEEPKKEIKQELEILEKEKFKKEKQTKKKTKNKTKIPKSQKKNEKFFEKVKNYLNSKQIEIINIMGFSKNDLILKIKEKEKEKLLFAFNKKTINEKDILKCNKKSQEENLTYKIFILGEQTRKITNMIEAIKNLDNIETIG